MKLPLDYVAPRDLLEGKTVLVTGAGDGIGRAVALGCARVGATVVLLGRTIRKLEAVYDAIEAANGPKPAIFGMDLRGAHPEHYDQLRDAIQGELGGLDAIVQNASVLGPLTPIEHYPALDWFEVLHVNVNA
ncbi:MAG: SDR family NAD(P)-dependent oxidoreductase, partial [Gammaproteobacteria bacterium]|nr:SDR family NAD(P)-dependent oxidoreductase [Gammaproteobacteria bacterium]